MMPEPPFDYLAEGHRIAMAKESANRDYRLDLAVDLGLYLAPADRRAWAIANLGSDPARQKRVLRSCGVE